MNELEKWVMGEMIDKLAEFKGVESSPSDLAYMLFEEANCNGSYTFSTFKAVQWKNTLVTKGHYRYTPSNEVDCVFIAYKCIR